VGKTPITYPEGFCLKQVKDANQEKVEEASTHKSAKTHAMIPKMTL